MWLLRLHPFRTTVQNNASDHHDQGAEMKALPFKAFSQDSSLANRQWRCDGKGIKRTLSKQLKNIPVCFCRGPTSLLFAPSRVSCQSARKVSCGHFKRAQFYTLTLGFLRAGVKKRRSGLLSIKRRGLNNFLRVLQTPSVPLAHASPTWKSALRAKTLVSKQNKNMDFYV